MIAPHLNFQETNRTNTNQSYKTHWSDNKYIWTYQSIQIKTYFNPLRWSTTIWEYIHRGIMFDFCPKYGSTSTAWITMKASYETGIHQLYYKYSWHSAQQTQKYWTFNSALLPTQNVLGLWETSQRQRRTLCHGHRCRLWRRQLKIYFSQHHAFPSLNVPKKEERKKKKGEEMTPIMVATETEVWPPAGVFNSRRPEEGEEVWKTAIRSPKHTERERTPRNRRGLENRRTNFPHVQ